MMPTCQDIITRALRKARVYAAGETPSAEDMADGLEELQNLYEQWGSNGMFGRLADVYTNDDYEAAPNERITITDGGVVTIPDTVEDDGSDYPPYDTAFVEVIDVAGDSVERHIYENGAWTLISGLALSDEAPLASKGRSGLAACLALAYAEEFGAQIGPGVMRQAAAFKTGLSLKYGGDAQRTAPDYY
jgi:hypothetical protein